MCGIFGVLSTVSARPCPPGGLEAALARLAHRGPDAAGTWSGGAGELRVELGHRRLSVIDLAAAANQPFVAERGGRRVVVVYNGEVYNYRELRRELEAGGASFRTASDTEVVAQAFLAWGPSSVSRLRGMFAFAVWDEAEARLVLARDRLGIKPLYVLEAGGHVAFSSELPPLRVWAERAGLPLPLDETALWDFLTYLYVPTPKTPFTDVRKVRPATTVSYARRASGWARAEDEYWDVAFGVRRGVRAEDATREVREKLEEAVRAHLVSDVPLGSLLSGGVDSSAVTALAARARGGDALRTFAIGFDVAEHSETDFARLAAERMGTRHTESIVSLALAQGTLAELHRTYGEPYGDLSAIPTMEVCRVAREHVTVALSGDGGDELFGGYGSYDRHARRARWFARAPAALRRLPALLEATGLERARGVPTLVDGLRDELERHAVVQGGFTRAQKRRALGERVAARFAGYDDLWYFRRHHRPAWPLLDRLQYLDLKTYLEGDILVKVDRASMRYALELRPPLLDHELVELVAGLPAEVRCPGGVRKHLFKAAVRDVVPQEILDRAKKGFSIPLARWVDALGAPAGAPWMHPTQRMLLAEVATWEAELGARAPIVPVQPSPRSS